MKATHLISMVLLLPFTLNPAFQQDSELRGATTYKERVDWVNTFPPTSDLNSGIPGEMKSVGTAEAQTIRNGFSFGNDEESNGTDIISRDFIERPVGWDFLPEELLIPTWLTETQTVDRTVKFQNTSTSDWEVEGFSITVGDGKEQTANPSHSTHQIVEVGTDITAETVEDFTVPAGETVYLTTESDSPNIHTVYTNSNGDISGLSYVERISYSVNGDAYSFTDYATAGIAPHPDSDTDSPEQVSDDYSILSQQNFCGEDGEQFGLCGGLFVSSSGQTASYVSPIDLTYQVTGRVIKNSGDVFPGIVVILEKSRSENQCEDFTKVDAMETDSDGRYLFEDLGHERGCFKLTAYEPDSEWRVTTAADLHQIPEGDYKELRELTDTILSPATYVVPPKENPPPKEEPPREEPPRERPPKEEPPREDPPKVTPPPKDDFTGDPPEFREEDRLVGDPLPPQVTEEELLPPQPLADTSSASTAPIIAGAFAVGIIGAVLIGAAVFSVRRKTLPAE